jgi:hypothetical protein
VAAKWIAVAVKWFPVDEKWIAWLSNGDVDTKMTHGGRGGECQEFCV